MRLVIDYIVKEQNLVDMLGWKLCNPSNLLGFNDVDFNAKFNHKKSEFGLDGGSHFLRNLKGCGEKQGDI